MRRNTKYSWFCYPRIQAQIAKGIRTEQSQAMKQRGWFTDDHIAFLDFDALFFDLQTFKNGTLRRVLILNVLKAQIQGASWKP